VGSETEVEVVFVFVFVSWTSEVDTSLLTVFVDALAGKAGVEVGSNAEVEEEEDEDGSVDAEAEAEAGMVPDSDDGTANGSGPGSISSLVMPHVVHRQVPLALARADRAVALHVTEPTPPTSSLKSI
jgi:hypothetical protein